MNDPPENQTVPPEYGKIIYRLNEKSPRQLYIIASSHRNTENKSNDSNTVQTQAEIFRIGEWLNRYRNIELLLPEGYFGPGNKTFPVDPSPVDVDGDSDTWLSNILLLRKLTDESRFVNAEILLMECFRMHISQVEDEEIYDAVRLMLTEMKANGFDRLPPSDMKAELLYLQQLRTAMLLQKIPAVIENELLTGVISNCAAVFTIGLNHIQDILRYFESNKIEISAPAYSGSRVNGYSAALNLVNSEYGITIIIPRTLADNRRLLQLTNLEGRLLADKGMSVHRLSNR